MTPWLVAAIGLVPALGAAVIMCARGNAAARLAAVQLAGSIAVLLLVVLTFALDQPSSIDLALTLALLTLPATLLYALFLERWL
ncbi:MAG TPA: monovalent cation/H+ antiporter complex subunit F [Stellaceae bacterium]|nr:monovalent cation/H+ antiporter complex subunit F [Stellaceae bacterium]HUC11915.1 monovalent cation/H+ antiporter complex subunit F [Stellaceae bacterium]